VDNLLTEWILWALRGEFSVEKIGSFFDMDFIAGSRRIQMWKIELNQSAQSEIVPKRHKKRQRKVKEFTI
jgi:hypothetical protein